jgi:large repetitive protein
MRNFYVFARVALLCIAWLVGFEGLAQSRYWVGGSGNWSDSQHWSYSSGGKGGASVPTQSNFVFVDKNSFKSDGVITLNQDIKIGGLIWYNDVVLSGFEGNYTIVSAGSLIFESTRSWGGTIILTSSTERYVSFPSSSIDANILFESQANYYFLSSLTTKGTLEVEGNNVNFGNHKIKAQTLIAPNEVKKTAFKTGFLKTTEPSQNNFFQVDFDLANISCSSSVDGSIKINKVTAGGKDVTATTTFQWTDAGGKIIPGTTLLENLAGGSYFLKMTNGTLKDVKQFVVKPPIPLTFDDFSVSNASCNGGNGNVSLSLIGGTAPYKYVLNANAPVSFDGSYLSLDLANGTYSLTIIDNHSCPYDYSNASGKNEIVISQPAPIVLTATHTDVKGCFGNSNGSISIVATGGTVDSPLECSYDGSTYVLLPADGKYTFPSLPSGTYSNVTVRRVNNVDCKSVAPAQKIDQPVKLSANVSTIPVSGCSATPDGQIVITGATGGSGRYHFSKDGGSTWFDNSGSASYTFTGVKDGNYKVWVEDLDNLGCRIQLNGGSDVVVTAKPTLTATVTFTDITCNGANNGVITITNPQGGSGIYDYTISGSLGWKAGDNSGTGGLVFSALPPKPAPGYTVQIRDNKNQTGCVKVIGNVVMSDPAPLNASIVAVPVTGCYNSKNGSITFSNPTGGRTAPPTVYEFTIDGTTWSTSASFPNLNPGLKTPIKMRDQAHKSCEKNFSDQTIVGPAQIKSGFTSTNVTVCADAANGSITFINPTGGSGSFEFSIDGNFTYSVPVGNQFKGLTAGTHSLYVRNKATHDCAEHIGDVTITAPAVMSAIVTSTPSCYGKSTGSITVSNPTGGLSGTYKYSRDKASWFTGTGGASGKDYTFMNLPKGDYPIYIQDAANPTCIKLLSSPTTPVGETNNLTADVKVNPATGCTITSNGSIEVTNPAGAVSGQYEYRLNSGAWSSSGSFPNLAPGDYDVFIREKNSVCDIWLGKKTVSPPSLLKINTIDKVDPSCYIEAIPSGSITVNASGGTPGLSYTINTGESPKGTLFEHLKAGKYTVTVTDAAGCSKSSDVELLFAAQIVPTVTHEDVSCAGKGKVTITALPASGTYQYSIKGGAAGTFFPSGSFTGQDAGSYSAVVMDSKGCLSNKVPVTIKDAVVLDVAVVSVTPVKCNGESSGIINLKINSGTPNYYYNIGSGIVPLVGTSITGLKAKSGYPLTISDDAGCSKDLGTVDVGEPDPITATIDKQDDTGCSGNPTGYIKIINPKGGTPSLTFSYTLVPSFGSNPNFLGLVKGDYPVVIKDGAGCMQPFGTVKIGESKLDIDLTATVVTNVACNGDKTGSIAVAAIGGSGSYSYSISDGTIPVGNKFDKLGQGNHDVTVKDNTTGCSVTKKIPVSEPSAIIPHIQKYDITCKGLGNGRILVAPTGGTTKSNPYVISLTPTAAFDYVKGEFGGLGVNTNYTVTVEDNNACKSVTSGISIAEPPLISITSQFSKNPTCSSGGTIKVEAEGGTPPLKFTLIKDAAVVTSNDNGVFSVGAGNYTVDVTDANNCAKASTTAMTLTSPSPIVFSNIVTPKINCNSEKTSITLTVSGIVGTPTVTLAKDGVATTAPIVTKIGANYEVKAANLSGGKYTVTVTDSNDPTCKQSQDIDIIEPTALTLDAPAINPPTSGNNGSISILAHNGTPSYTYTITPGSLPSNNTGIFNGLGMGTYTIKVVDANGCIISSSPIALSSISATAVGADISCFGANDGMITVSIAGGVSPFTIKLTPPSPGAVQTFSTTTSPFVIDKQGKGSYLVDVSDSYGTTVPTVTVAINEPDALTIALQNGTARLCAGTTTGKIDVAITGGKTPYNISWVGDNAGVPTTGGKLVGQSITELSAGKYVVTVKSAGGVCVATAEHTIIDNPAITFTVDSKNPICGSPTSGSIGVTVTSTNSAATYSYAKDGITFDNTDGKFTGLSQGAYTIAVKDGLGCQSANQNVSLTSPTAISIADVTKTDTKCAIGGTVTVKAAGGGGDLTYKLLRSGSKVLVASNTNSLGEFTFVDVAAGKYLVEVTDGGTCPASWPSAITIANGGGSTTIKVVTYTVDNIRCFGDLGKATIKVTGVQGTLSCAFVNKTTGVTLTEGVDYTFKATPGANAGDYTIEVGGFTAGSYNMFISDDNACPQKFPFGISGPTKLKIDSVTKQDPSSKSSADGSITVVASGGVKLGAAPGYYTYSKDGTDFSNTTGVFEKLNPGKYIITVKDKNRCIVATDEIELIAKSNLDIDDIIIGNPKCHKESNGTIDIYASGGSGKMRYSIYGDDETKYKDDSHFEGLPAGKYTVCVKDEANVVATREVELVDPDPVVVALIKTQTPSANGATDGSIIVKATGGSGNYVYSLVDVNSGMEMSNVTTGSVEVNFNKLPSGTYTITATDDNGCSGTVGPIVLEELSLYVTITHVKCANEKTGKLDVDVKGGAEPFKLTWQPTGGTVNGPFDVTDRKYSIPDLDAGDYIISVTDGTGTTETMTATIKPAVTLLASVKAKPETICAGTTDGKVELDISGGNPGYKITWVADTPGPEGATGTVTGTTISGLWPSKYHITITDADGAGCSLVLDTEVESYPAIVIDKVEPTQPKCNGDLGSVKVTASGGVGELKYSATIDGVLVENTTGLFDKLKPGSYTISVTDTKGCVNKTAIVEILEPKAIVITVVEVKDVTCTTKGKITVTAEGGTGKLTFSNGTDTNETGIFDNLEAKTYTITVTDEASCSASKDVPVVSTAALKITNLVVEDVKCNGKPTGKISFNVDGATAGLVVTVNGNPVTPDAAGLYTVDGLKAGPVTINAKDDSGCDITEQPTIVEPTAVTAEIIVTSVPKDPADPSGAIQVTVHGGSGVYDIICINPDNGINMTITAGEDVAAIFNKLPLGKYTITVDDGNSCPYTGEVTIANLSMTAKGIAGSCKDPKGSIEVTIADGAKPYTVTYTKKGDATVIETKTGNENVVTFTGMDAGDYTVKVVDNSGVEVTADVNVPVYTAPTIALVAKCFINSDYYIEIKVPEGLKDYTVKCTDADGVEYTSYDMATHRISKLQPNKTYSVQVFDALGCPSEVLTVEIATLPEMKVEDASITDVLCHGAVTGKIELKASGGTEPLAYSNKLAESTVAGTPQNKPLFEPLAAGKYRTTVMDAAGCYANLDLEITEPTELLLTLDDANSNTKIWCASKAIGKLAFKVADAVPAYTISLYDSKEKLVGSSKTLDAPGDGFFDALMGDDYKLVAVDKNGCQKSVEKNIDGNHITVVSDITSSECRRFVNPDDAKTLGGVYTLKEMGGDFGPEAAYYFKKGVNLSSEPVEPTAMPGQDGYYLFEAGKPRTISQLQGVYYSILAKVEEARGVCEEEIPFWISVKPENDFSAVADPDKSVCINSAVEFKAKIGANTEESKYEYENGAVKLDNNFNPVPKRYTVEWTNVGGSGFTTEYTADAIANLTKKEVLSADKITSKAPFKLTNPYIFRVTSSNNKCYDVDTAKVFVYPFSDPYISGPLVKEVDGVGYFMRMPLGATQNLQLKYRNEGFTPSLIWNPAEAEWLTIDDKDNTKFTINNKFSDEASLLGMVSYKINTTEICQEYVGLKVMPLSTINPPNAFTPNGDGYNDTWRVIYEEEMADYPNIEVEIYNRWGSVVYHSKPYKNDWNGRHNGKDLPVGTYYYVLKLHRGNLPNISGAVSIIR